MFASFGKHGVGVHYAPLHEESEPSSLCTQLQAQPDSAVPYIVWYMVVDVKGKNVNILG